MRRATEQQRKALFDYLGIKNELPKYKIKDLNLLISNDQIGQLEEICKPIFDMLNIKFPIIPMVIKTPKDFDSQNFVIRTFEGSTGALNYRNHRPEQIVFREGVDTFNALFNVLPHEVSHAIYKYGFPHSNNWILPNIMHEVIAYRGANKIRKVLSGFYGITQNETMIELITYNIKQIFKGDIEHGIANIVSLIPFPLTLKKEYEKVIG